MASNSGPIMGQFMHGVIDSNTEPSSPWERNYGQPPKMEHMVPRSYPLIDMRPMISKSDYSPSQLLKTHGFGVVRQRSNFLDHLDQSEGELSEQALTEAYHPEICDLIKQTLGAKEVLVMVSALRQGSKSEEPYKQTTGINYVTKASAQQESNLKGLSVHQKLASQPNLGLSKPLRTPHLDYTPLGARQTIRSVSSEVYAAAKRCGVIAYEDKLCESLNIQACTKDANTIIAELYEGPRYATYSIWRPLRKVERDPIALAPRREVAQAPGELVYWPYMNRFKGRGDFTEEWLREFAYLGVQAEKLPPRQDTDSPLKWYYLSEHQPDEVLFIQQFDSECLGPGAQYAGAPWHASPEIGDVYGTAPRESLELRVVAFW